MVFAINTNAEDQKRKKGFREKGFGEKKGENGRTLGAPTSKRTKGNKRNNEAYKQHPEKYGNMDSPRQFIQ